MPPKRDRNRQVTPPWLDTLIAWLEFIGLVGAILAGFYALATWLFD
jgi:hypothetical protein